MASSSPLMHPSLLARMNHFYNSTVTIQEYTPAQNSYGEEVKAWANLASHIDLQCSRAAAGGREVKRPDGTIAISPWRIAISEYKPSIVPKMRAVLGSANYDILAVEHDSKGNTTSLDCEIVT